MNRDTLILIKFVTDSTQIMRKRLTAIPSSGWSATTRETPERRCGVVNVNLSGTEGTPAQPTQPLAGSQKYNFLLIVEFVPLVIPPG